METLRPVARASASAHLSGPSQPPETTMEFMGSDFTIDLTAISDINFLDPITPTLIGKDSNPIPEPKSRLFHHQRSFLGCFSCRLRKNIDYESVRRWKDNPEPQKTMAIAEIIAGYVTNHYDFITTAPPSAHRNLDSYCCFKLAGAVSAITGIPFMVSFQQRQFKSKHGRFESLRAEAPVLMPGWNYHGKSILFIDDFITSGMTAKTCYDALRAQGNHVDGLIYCQF